MDRCRNPTLVIVHGVSDEMDLAAFRPHDSTVRKAYSGLRTYRLGFPDAARYNDDVVERINVARIRFLFSRQDEPPHIASG